MIREMFAEGRWLLNRGALRNPCEGAGCKRWILKGEHYWRDASGDHFCRECTPEPCRREARVEPSR